MANKKISELPYINSSKISGNTLVPLVTYFSAVTGDTVYTYVSDFESYLNLQPFSGGSGNCITDLYVTNVYGCSPITLQNSLQNNQTTSTGDLSHSEGFGTETAINNAYSAQSVSSGLITLSSTYGDVTGEFSAGDLLLFYDIPFDNTYGSTITTISASTFNGVETEIQLQDINITTTTAYVGDISYGISSWTGDQTIPGHYSHAEGYATASMGQFSHAEGSRTYSIGENSHAEGYRSLSIGKGSHSEGVTTQSIGTYSHSEGSSTQSIGYGSHSEGSNTKSIGYVSHSEGRDTSSIGDHSHSEGISTKSGYKGYLTSTPITSGVFEIDTSYGDLTSIFTTGSFIIFQDNYAEINTGVYTSYLYEVASSTYNGTPATEITLVDTSINTSSANSPVGIYNSFGPLLADQSMGAYSHSEGTATQAIGEFSHSEGEETVSLGWGQTVVGRFNDPISTPSAFIVGDGENDTKRHNLLVASNSGVTISGALSATTYLNLPVGFTGAYLPLSGGTVTGPSIFTSGVTANTISNTTYIDFNTGSTLPSTTAGRVFYDNTSKALSYYGVGTNIVPIAMGQQLYVRGNNATGTQINKGSVVMVTGTTNTLPSIALATNNHEQGSPRPIGLVADNIPNGSDGLVIVNGILSGITLNTFANGDTLYLSNSIPGGYVSSTSSLPFSARTNEIGYVLQTGTTTGKIYVNINSEDSNLTLTDIERNILEGNVISTGIYEYTGMSVASSTTINVAPARGWIVNNTYNFATLPDVTNLYYSGGTGITITNIATADATYILLTSASTITQQTTFPTPQQRRENILLGKVVHPNRTSILNVNNTVDFDVSPMSALRDLWTPIRLINQGVIPSANTGLTINTTAGTLWGNGIGWVSNQLNPDSVSISAKTPASFFYRTQTGGTSGSVSVIDPTKYDVGGVITSMGAAGADDSSNQRIYLYPTGVINILYGQHKYNNLAAAVAAIQSETFVVYPNAETTGILIGVLSVRNDIVADGESLTNTDYAKFTLVSKFGESFGGTGGLSTTTLQQAYNNSTTPEIVINSILDGLSIKNGTGNANNVTNLFEGVNASGTTTSIIRADGAISGSSFSGLSSTISGTKGTITTSGSSTTALLTFSGSNTVGGTGYTDFIRVTNTAAGATTPSKTFRTDISGSFEIINNAYNSTLLSLTDAGNLTVAGRVKSTINYSQTGGGASVTLGASASPQTILSVSLTTYGNPVMICAYGDAENTGAGYWCTLQLWRDSTQIGAIVHAEGSAGSENIPFAMTYYDAPAAGTYTYYLKANQVTGGNFKFGESTAPILNAREL